MSTITARRMCRTCGQRRLFEKQKQNNILHLIMSVLTAGVWLPVWLLIALCNAFKPLRCPICGEGRL